MGTEYYYLHIMHSDNGSKLFIFMVVSMVVNHSVPIIVCK